MKLMRKPAQVIALFDFEGNAVPIRLRYEDESQELRIIKVSKVIRKDKDKLAGNAMIKYTCETCDNGVAKLFELRFEIDSQKWYLYKI